jgi:hypothetical protein
MQIHHIEPISFSQNPFGRSRGEQQRFQPLRSSRAAENVLQKPTLHRMPQFLQPERVIEYNPGRAGLLLPGHANGN